MRRPTQPTLTSHLATDARGSSDDDDDGNDNECPFSMASAIPAVLLTWCVSREQALYLGDEFGDRVQGVWLIVGITLCDVAPVADQFM